MASARLLLVVLSFLYRLIHRGFGALSLVKRDTVAKDAESLGLRHQLAVLSRPVARPRFFWSDRALIALLAALVPGHRWSAFVVTPKTILESSTGIAVSFIAAGPIRSPNYQRISR